MEKYFDYYEENFKSSDVEAFNKAVTSHEEAIERIYCKPGDIRLYGITEIVNDEVTLVHDNGDGTTDTVNFTPESLPIWENTQRFAGMALILERGNLNERIIPVSDNVKLSVSNRTGLSFKGAISEQKISKTSLGKVMEDLIKQHNKNSMQLICIEGKVKSILTAIYKYTEQPVIFAAATDILADMPAFSFAGGHVSHTSSMGVYQVQDIPENKIQAFVAVSDSSTGDAGVTINPILKMNGRYASMDDAWFSRHCKIELSEIRSGTRAAIQKAKDNVTLLANTATIVLQNPLAYLKNAIEKLNGLAKRMGSLPIGKKAAQDLENNLEDMLWVSSKITVWDIIELLWDYPAQSSSDDNRLSTERTVSRILSLNHAELDVIKN